MTRTRRADYRRVFAIQTRWSDNDIYGHVNNVAYYGYFDTIVNDYLIAAGGLDIHSGPVIGLVVETGCRYFESVAFPDALDGGLRVARIGNTSVRYELGIFRSGAPESTAEGFFVHVYVDRTTRRPVPLPGAMRAALEALCV